VNYITLLSCNVGIVAMQEIQFPGQTVQTQASIRLRSVNEPQQPLTVGDCYLKNGGSLDTDGHNTVCVALPGFIVTCNVCSDMVGAQLCRCIYCCPETTHGKITRHYSRFCAGAPESGKMFIRNSPIHSTKL